jgi:hypothetical protein
LYESAVKIAFPGAGGCGITEILSGIGYADFDTCRGGYGSRFFFRFFSDFIDSSYGRNISETRAVDAGAVGESTSRR